MINTIIGLMVGGVIGIFIMSCLSINTIDEERDKAFQRGFDQGRYGGKKRD